MKNKSCLVWDRGLYLCIAQRLSESFGKVYYYIPQANPYPNSAKAQIGVGLDGIERVHNFWDIIDKVDLIVFPDCYDGELQHWLRSKGYCVFGNGRSEIVELDKLLFIDLLKEVGLPTINTVVTKGLEELVNHLSKVKSEKWLKTNWYRGDFETHKFINMDLITPWLTDLAYRLGTRAHDIEILIQDSIKAECEAGYDGFLIDGKYSDNCLTGYEIKDRGLVAKVTKNPAPIVKFVNDKMAPVHKYFGGRGHYSTEIRITKDGTPYYIDSTQRAPSPPSELMLEIYDNYPEIIWQVANGEVPDVIPRAEFGAELILTSDWHEQHELCVQFPKEFNKNVKLKNHSKRGDSYWCTPNDNAGYFGAVVAYGNTVGEATDKVMEIAKQIKADDFHVDEEVFEEADEQIKNGEKFGIHF